MKKDKVLDSYALLAYFEGEPAGQKVKVLLQEAAEQGRELLMSVVNWGEVLYIVERRAGKDKRQDILQLMSQMHLTIVSADKALAEEAATFKASNKMSYADCFAAALAKVKRAELVTGDKEFESVASAIKIHWI